MHAEDVMSILAQGHGVQKKAHLDQAMESGACTSAVHLVSLSFIMYNDIEGIIFPAIL